MLVGLQGSLGAGSVFPGLDIGHRERRYAPHKFARQAQHFTAGGEDFEIRTGLQKFRQDGGARPKQMLTIINNQESLPGLEMVDQLTAEWFP